MGELGSAAVPPVGPGDHLRGAGDDLIVYADLGCAACAAAWPELAARPARLVFRHFPVASKHPRAPALHAAAEAAGAQGRFFEMVDSLYADRGRVDDPHLWERAEALGLDLARFEADRRSTAVATRVRSDFESGIRAGVSSTPALFGRVPEKRRNSGPKPQARPQVCTLSATENESSESIWPPSGRPEVGKLNEHV